jgi:hypothetical protein
VEEKGFLIFSEFEFKFKPNETERISTRFELQHNKLNIGKNFGVLQNRKPSPPILLLPPPRPSTMDPAQQLLHLWVKTLDLAHQLYFSPDLT